MSEVKCLAAKSSDGTVHPFSYNLEGDLQDEHKINKHECKTNMNEYR